MIKAAAVTVSDRASRGEREDRSGPILREVLEKAGIEVATQEVIPDDYEVIRGKLLELIPSHDLVVTTGGTGVGEKDFTYDATQSVIEKELPGFGEVMRTLSFSKTPLAIISRAMAGTVGKCLVLNLPGSPKGVKECLEPVLPAIQHLVDVLKQIAKDCAEDRARWEAVSQSQSGSEGSSSQA